MKIGVAGLGAVGGLVAARLALSGAAVAALARPTTVAAMRARGGLLFAAPGAESRTVPLNVTADAREIGRVDLLFIALKGHALASDADQLAPLVGPQTTIVPLMNGVPWWFLEPTGDARPLAAVDPDGRIAGHLPARQTLGAVVHLSCSSPAPGEVRHGFGERLILGEPDGRDSPRLQQAAALLQQAGFTVAQSNDIRRDIWFKLWGNMTTNPISALTRATSDKILDDDLVRAFMARAMDEAAAIGAAIGCPIAQSAEDRMTVTRQLGAFKTSMLQDAEAGRRLELDALVGAVREIGARVGVPTPHIDTVFGLARLMATQTGLR